MQQWNLIIDDNMDLKVIHKYKKLISNKQSNSTNEVFKNIKSTNFSIDNEKILEKITNITKLENINKINSLQLLQFEDLITNYLSRYLIQNTVVTYSFINSLLNWILKTSEVLAGRIKQSLKKHSSARKYRSSIPRSSYKFCTYKDKCEYNYKKSSNGCCADHYIHSSVHADILALQEFIDKQDIKDDKIQGNREINKCINTLSYVIRHMWEELNNICLYVNKDKYEEYHIINIKKKSSYTKKKKKYTKKP